jgi:hypothetical protein
MSCDSPRGENWSIFLKHAAATMEALRVPKKECDEVAGC